ncbi:family 43 glycosylhydrolase [Marivirga lumbricoides]
MIKRSWNFLILIVIFFNLFLEGCKDMNEEGTGITVGTDTTDLDDGPIDFSLFRDNYADIASPTMTSQWMHYNVHDPAFIDDGTFIYCYSTDVAYGHDVRPGLQIRRSLNMVEWEFVGWVFDGLPTLGAQFIRNNGGEPFNSLWAPYTIKVGSEYRVYYSLSSATPRLSVIGMASSTSPEGPFTEKGLVVTSTDDNSRQTNAIDPTIVVDKSGKHWMYYGSAWDGIYIVELDPETGLAAQSGDKGTRVAQRGFTGNSINGNIEGPEIIYNEEFDKYYLFIAYDWLETKYNVRVGRADNPEGPFFDIRGINMNDEVDDLPMILAPYAFMGHPGWQGVSHPGIVERNGNYYLGHQGRPGSDRFYMILHTRQIHWTQDGWPMVSPQRYAGEEETPVTADELAGKWEQIVFGYTVVPGFGEEQLNPGFQRATTMTIDAEGTMNGEAANTWTYEAPWLTLSWGDGAFVDKVFVERGRDWENEIESTLLFTGFNQDFTTVWGKKLQE